MNSACILLAAALTAGAQPPDAQPKNTAPPAAVVQPAPVVAGPGCADCGAPCGCDPCASSGKVGLLSRLRNKFSGGGLFSRFKHKSSDCCDSCGSAYGPAGCATPGPVVAPPPTGTTVPMDMDPKKGTGGTGGKSQIIPLTPVIPVAGPLDGTRSPY